VISHPQPADPEQSLGIHYNEPGEDLLDYLLDTWVFDFHDGHITAGTPGLGVAVTRERACADASSRGDLTRDGWIVIGTPEAPTGAGPVPQDPSRRSCAGRGLLERPCARTRPVDGRRPGRERPAVNMAVVEVEHRGVRR